METKEPPTTSGAGGSLCYYFLLLLLIGALPFFLFFPFFTTHLKATNWCMHGNMGNRAFMGKERFHYKISLGKGRAWELQEQGANTTFSHSHSHSLYLSVLERAWALFLTHRHFFFILSLLSFSSTIIAGNE